MLTVASCASETLSPFGYFFSSSSARTVRPVSVVVAADGVNGKGGGVVIRSHADPASIVVDVINAVRHRAFQLGINEVMYIDLFGCAFGSPFAARILEIADQLLLFRIDRDDRLAVRQKTASLFVDVFELTIPVHMLASFVGFSVGL